MDRELLVEVGCEELPASWLPSLTRQLGDRMASRLSDFRLVTGAPIETFSTPRRLAARLARLADRQTDLEEIVTGPPISAAYLPGGEPTAAATGFARKHEIDVAQLGRLETPKGIYLTARKHARGRAAADVLAGVLAAVLRDLTFPKLMRWDAVLGESDLLFGRPIRWILFLYGGRVVPFTIGRAENAQSAGVQEIRSGAVTYGHRFLATTGRPGRALKVRTFEEYRSRLVENFVVLERSERHDKIARELDAKAQRLGGRVSWSALHHSPLLQEVPDLVEYPSVIAGTFSSDFVRDLPEEVLITSMIHHQHFFPVVNDVGRLKPAFLAVTNTRPENEPLVARNAERVLAARLRDARFFWEADRQQTIGHRLERLETVLFHKELGSYRAKAERIERLTRWITESVWNEPEVTAAAASAARLSKADLTTEMVREFTELQGTMGGIYAREEGLPEEIWKAIYYHYLPTGVESDAPPGRADLGRAAVTWSALSLADKLDTVVGLFAVGERPTGSRDPFGIRRQTHGILRVLVDLEPLTGLKVRPSLSELLERALEPFAEHRQRTGVEDAEFRASLEGFFKERLAFLFEQRGADVRNIRAVLQSRTLSLSPGQAAQLLKVLPDFTGSPDFTRLATAFKRVRNIARELDDDEFSRMEAEDPSLKTLREPAEVTLRDEIERRAPIIEGALRAGEEYRRAFAEAAQFGPSVDRFFTEVFVMVDDPVLRTSRLRLMRRLEALILQLADISEVVAPTES